MPEDYELIPQADGSMLKDVYDSETGKHDLYTGGAEGGGDGTNHSHTVYFDSAVDEDMIMADYVREGADDIVYDSQFYGPSDDRDSYFDSWQEAPPG